MKLLSVESKQKLICLKKSLKGTEFAWLLVFSVAIINESFLLSGNWEVLDFRYKSWDNIFGNFWVVQLWKTF